MSASFQRPPPAQDIHNALAGLFRALQARKFYPAGHPSRLTTLNWAYTTMVQLLDGNSLSLSCSRTGFSFPDGKIVKGATTMSSGLAYELFIRRVNKITFSHDLFQEDVLEFIKLLSLEPEQIHQSGRMDVILAERGVRTIWVNEFDLEKIRGKRAQVEQTGVVPSGVEESEIFDSGNQTDEQLFARSEELPPEQQLQSLFDKIVSCTDNDTYLTLIRQAVACVDNSMVRQGSRTLFNLIDLLASHAGDRQHSQVIQECAHFALEQIVVIFDIVPAVLERAEQGAELPYTTLKAVVSAGGIAAIAATIETLGRSQGIKTRKTLTTLLGDLGEPAVPLLLTEMQDSRWFIKRSMCAILGTIGSHEALPAVTECLKHPDIRVRKEAVRSLMQIGGTEAESAIIGVLHSPDKELYPQAVASLGGMKSKKSLLELIKIVNATDIFLTTLPLKIDALAAIALIGDRQATPLLVMFMEKRHLLALPRDRQLKTAIAECLGKLGDSRALPILTKFSSSSGELAGACTEAIRMIKTGEGLDGND